MVEWHQSARKSAGSEERGEGRIVIWNGNRRLGLPAVIVALLSVIGLLSWAAPATAGQGAVAPAGIIGQVTDGTGAVLPGVTVTATSPALQVPSVVTVTDAQGDYRLTPLPIGTYTVTYELAGFQNLRREDVRLTVGFVAKVDQVMNVGAVSETITVSGASPLVDVTSTATRTEVTREALDVLPTTRDGLKAFLGQVPGLRTNLEIGSAGLTDGVTFRVYGQTGDSWQMLEGVVTASPASPGRSGSHMDFNSIEGTRVQTVGSNAEMPRRGILLDAVVKSGGNDFHGTAVAYGTSGRLEGSNVDAALQAQGIRGSGKLHTLRDFSGNVGGRIVRNKLWFFGGARYEAYDREVLDAFYDDGTPVLLNSSLAFQAEKVSYQMTPGNRFTAFYHRSTDFQRRDASRFIPPESRIEIHNPVVTKKVEWQAVRGNSLVTSLQYGHWTQHQNSDGVAPGKVATTDITTLRASGDALNDGKRGVGFRRHTKGIVSWYRPDLLAGNHELKAGFDHLFTGWNTPVYEPRQGGNYQLVYNNGVPFQINTFNYPVDPKNNAYYLGLYAQDAWTIARRLTLSLGVRYAHDNAFAPAQCRVAGDFAAAQCWDKIQMNIWNSVAPRLHAAYDPFGNGKTVIKGGWGRFDHFRELEPELTAINRNSPSATTWDWHDLNGNRAYDPGEVNLDPNGPDFRSIAGADRSAGLSTLARPNPNERQPKADEFSVTLERELMANWAVRVSGVYARNVDEIRLLSIQRPYEAYNIPITNADPGPDGRVGTGDDPGTFLTYYDYPASLNGIQFSETMRINDPDAGSNFKTIEVAGTKRLAQGWQLMASYTATRSDIPVPPGSAFNPNTEIFTANRTWEWSGKISGAYTFPYGIIASANYDYRSGEPQARQVLLTGGRQIRSLVVNAEPIGTIRLPSTSVMDFRAGKRLSLGAGRSVELRADVFNALNVNTTLTRVLRSGPEFLKTGVPTTQSMQVVQAIVLPRVVQLGATFAF